MLALRPPYFRRLIWKPRILIQPSFAVGRRVRPLVRDLVLSLFQHDLNRLELTKTQIRGTNR